MDNIENKAVEEQVPEIANDAMDGPDHQDLQSEQDHPDLVCRQTTGRNLIDILLPANPPPPINARLIRRLRD